MSGELIIDLFAGGGGASEGIFLATGRHPDVAVNHDRDAVDLHRANHPTTRHYCKGIAEVDPVEVLSHFPGRRVGLLWASPDCTHHSKARGGKPAKKSIRGLAWQVIRWVAAIKRVTGSVPRVIKLENVEEFQDWGPLGRDCRPIRARKGETFRLWVSQLEALGCVVEYRELVAAKFKTPTTRKRLFVIARGDGQAIVWPAPTNERRRYGELFASALAPWRSAAEIIDWSLPCPSIFGRKRPLASKTLGRVAKGVKRFVIEAPRPFIVPVTHTGPERIHDIGDPLRTVTAANRGEFSLVAPHLDRQFGSAVSGRSLAEAHPTVMADGGGAKSHLVATYIEQANTRSVGAGPAAPLPTVTGTSKHGIVAASLDAYYATGVPASPEDPLRTATARGRHGLTSAFMEQANGGMVGHDARAPVSTITGRGTQQRPVMLHLEELTGEPGSKRRAVVEFLQGHFGAPTAAEVADPMATPAGRLKFGLVIVDDIVWQIADIGMRMLVPRELYSAQGFGPEYIIDVTWEGRPLTKTAQTRMAGNSVCPPLAEALVRANCAWLAEAALAA